MSVQKFMQIVSFAVCFFGEMKMLTGEEKIDWRSKFNNDFFNFKKENEKSESK